MANRLVKCPHCEEQLKRGEAIRRKANKRYYHKDCYEEATRDIRHYKELIGTICRIWGINKPTMQMVRQLKMYREDPELKFTNKGMQLTLEYYYDLLGNKPREGDGVGIIPLNYDKAKWQYIRQMEIEESIEEFDGRREVKVAINSRKRKKKMIDIGSL